MRKNREMIFAVTISVVLHTAFFLFANHMKIAGFVATLQKTARIFKVKSIEKEIETYVMRERTGEPGYIESIKFLSPETRIEITGVDVEKEIKKKKDAAILAKKDIAQPSKELPFDEAELDKAPLKETEISMPKARPTTGSLVKTADISEVESAAGLQDAAEEPLPAEFMEKMPGITPTPPDIRARPNQASDTTRLTPKLTPSTGGKERYEGLDEYLVVDLATYRDERDGQKYFRIGISAGKDAGKLDTMAKEIIFIIDCSLSIQRRRLEPIKNGVVFCLKNLNADDVFNIMAFKDRGIWLSAAPLKADKRSIKSAVNFIDSLNTSEKTDVYRAFIDVIKKEETMMPSYLMLLSDGKPTAGITGSRDLINKISKMNGGVRPIFAFSGGARVNRYLLDFIAYKNRGWSEYTQRSGELYSGLARLYNKIKDPLLLNLRYNFGSIPDSDIYPKSLPDFFKGTAFMLYGKYGEKDEFSMQLLGDIGNVTKKFIFTGNLSGAAQGGYDIARGWAFNRIYYLIELLKGGSGDEAIKAEINALCKKFDIITPYSADLE